MHLVSSSMLTVDKNLAKKLTEGITQFILQERSNEMLKNLQLQLCLE